MREKRRLELVEIDLLRHGLDLRLLRESVESDTLSEGWPNLRSAS